MYKWRLVVVVLTAVLALVGALLQWHLTVKTTNVQEVVTGQSPIHKPMTAEKCYEIAQIRPSFDQVGRAFGYPDGATYLYTIDIGDGRYCTIDYIGGNDHPSSVSLDLR